MIMYCNIYILQQEDNTSVVCSE